MSQTVLSEGKDVTEAIEHGLDILGANKEEVSVEVVQQEKKGFLRLGSKRAIVKLTKTITAKKRKTSKKPDFSLEMIEKMIDKMEINLQAENDLHLAAKSPLEELEGKVWIKDGQVFCKHSELHLPTITSCNGVKLLKNNELVDGTTAVTEKDHFELQTVEEVKETKWNITMDSNKLNVYLHVEPGMRKTYKLKDKDPIHHIQLEAEEIIEINNDLNYKQVLERIGELRVIHGFNHSEIMKAVNTKSAGRFTIASGIKPKEGENGNIEIIVDTEKKIGLKERTNGTVDFREVQAIPAVQKGQVIAIVHPPIPGSPGYTVTNEPLPPKPTYPLIIQQGKGITLIEKGTKIVAAETGRPVIDQRGLMVKVSIIPKLVHYSDVNISSGNIRFMGDVDILGNVEEGMVAEAGGDIAIFKNVYSASISAKNTVSIYGNSIGSKISAGKQNIFTSDMVNLLSNIREQMEKLILSIIQLMSMPAIKKIDISKNGLLPLIKLLIGKKFQSLLRDVKKFIELNKKGSHLLDIEWLTLAEQLRLCFLTSVPNEYHSLERMNDLLKKMEKMVEKHDDKKDQECSVKLKYAINSEIYSGGDVIIQGQGSYNSKIHAGRNLIINGVFRGGELFAKVGAEVKESGSEGGVISKIRVPSNGTIKIEHAREGTVIQIGKTKFTFQTEQKYINARLNESGKITF